MKLTPDELMKIQIKNKIYEVEILDIENGKVKITVDGKDFVFGEKNKQGISVAKTSLPKRDFSKKEIRAPISGVISEIFVKEGEFIKEGKKLLLLSAMKMENEIISEFEGKVEKILVKKGKKVKTNQILVLIK